jgi:hypothetical protein
MIRFGLGEVKLHVRGRNIGGMEDNDRKIRGLEDLDLLEAWDNEAGKAGRVECHGHCVG